jgi:hypothetical protein
MRLIPADGQEAGFAIQRLAKHAAGPTGSGGIGLAGADDDGGQAHAAAIEVAFARVIIHQHLAHGFGDAVGGLRELLGGVGHQLDMSIPP